MKLGRILSAGRTVLSDWRWLPFFVQRRFRRPGQREAAVRLLARLRPTPGAEPASGSATAALRDEGQALLGHLLSRDACAEIETYLRERRVIDEYRPEVAPWLPLGEGRHPHSHVGYHRHEDVLRAPHLLALANRPDILAAVERFFGCRPTISYMAAWWSYATGIGAQQAENFHRDIDDWRFVKLFVYLSDVDEAKGPHVYVRKSANLARLNDIRRCTDEEVAAAFPAEDIVTMTGDAGTGFLENTFGLHKGRPVEQGHRLMFQVVYSMLPLPYGPRRPVIGREEAAACAGTEIDPYVNRVYVARKP
jgi:hypothetical protein